MKKLRALFALLLLASTAFAQRFTGYTDASTDQQKKIEAALKAIPLPEKEREFHRYFTAEPHPAGSEENHRIALHIAEEWRRQGWDEVRIHRYDVLNSTPREVKVEMVEPVPYVAGLREAAYDVDPDTKNLHVRGGYVSMSASGEVTAPLVYARGGNPEDYDLLAKSGIDVRGKVVIVRYSNPYSYRGFKALTAQQRGVAALIIYSDPAEDGYKKGKVFPDGPWGPETHIQRGAITYDFIVPGDPLTPGWASVEGARRIKPEEAQSVPKIMAVAMSWHDAKPLLEQMDGPEAPKDWQGGLPITYRLGGGRVKVHLKIDMDNSIKPNYVVEARLRGAELPDQWVLIGNHHDAWEFGGVDPSSGTASMMELTRALGEMAKKGMRPRRTLIACSWDGEEVGLTGSTEWGENFAPDLRQKLVAYINVDSAASGPNFQGSAVGSLAPLLVEISKTLDDPSGKSLYEAWKKSAAADTERFAATGGGKRKAVVDDDSLVDTRIGSGSDHTVFLNFLGRPVVGLNFDGPYGVYHSMYDDFYWMNHFGDPGYRYHTLMSQLWGVLALRLADADVLPFDFGFYGRDIRKFVEEIAEKPGARQSLDLSPALKRVDEFQAAGRELKAATEASLAAGTLDAKQAAALNRSVLEVESNWLNPDGIPGRPWFKHMLYAARYTYAHLELPGITEAVEKQDWKTAREQTTLLENALAKNTDLLKTALADLRGAK
ncbi:MAG: M28 family metallopeptidase [Acidobacteriia bacterium]|nr:M28 family metallopeptidase [Terriglobia bacterium]